LAHFSLQFTLKKLQRARFQCRTKVTIGRKYYVEVLAVFLELTRAG
jgi:hypothetical protein